MLYCFIGGRKFRDLPAYIVWLVVHLIQLIGFSSRLIVLINSAWDYFLYERKVRVITGESQKLHPGDIQLP